ncbi:MAG: PASTA domain-containing protein [Sumerlaeia bacterium]
MGIVGGILFVLAGLIAYGLIWKFVKTPEVEAPDLLALPAGEALLRASETGFALRVSAYEPSEQFEPGTVLAQRPPPGAWAKSGAIISLTVSE